MKKLEIATGFAQYKVLLAILGVLTSLASFEVFKLNQKQHEKYVAEKQKACQQALDIANQYVEGDRTLRGVRYAAIAQEQFNKKINHPGISTDFQSGKNYILMYSQPTSLIPDNPRHEGKLFERLSQKTDKYLPEPLMVTGQKISGNKAQVTSACSPNPFTVALDNLYEIAQPIDINPYLPPFSSF
ncbi:MULTISPECIES: hypothetical protein [Nostoc]|uniref:Uncharacterized protein n=1 Tax=Nostoc paludosum FACHB-159 TaxID=2692908 RepID=A0ABR8KGG1_9NOSO|nr:MULTISPECIES: hypothetical protein [Nostoc]MBD2680908.1 hypothetical protein [Nostoc sp. FACHB-857]MBD2737385.1 hypothetical protein [Nostoc paludosum FACHB-159]